MIRAENDPTWQRAYTYAHEWLMAQHWPVMEDYECIVCHAAVGVPCDRTMIDPVSTLAMVLYGASNRRLWQGGFHRARYNRVLVGRDMLRGQMIDIEMEEWKRLKAVDA